MGLFLFSVLFLVFILAFWFFHRCLVLSQSSFTLLRSQLLSDSLDLEADALPIEPPRPPDAYIYIYIIYIFCVLLLSEG